VKKVLVDGQEVAVNVIMTIITAQQSSKLYMTALLECFDLGFCEEWRMAKKIVGYLKSTMFSSLPVLCWMSTQNVQST